MIPDAAGARRASPIAAGSIPPHFQNRVVARQAKRSRSSTEAAEGCPGCGSGVLGMNDVEKRATAVLDGSTRYGGFNVHRPVCGDRKWSRAPQRSYRSARGPPRASNDRKKRHTLQGEPTAARARVEGAAHSSFQSHAPQKIHRARQEDDARRRSAAVVHWCRPMA